MSFSTDQFRASFQSEPASQALFEIEILSAPKVLPYDVRKNLTFRCEEGEFPGKIIGTTEWKDYGPMRKIAYGSIYQDSSFQIMITDDMSEKRFFNDWHDFITNDEINSDVKYYRDYTGEVRITQLSKDGKRTHSVILREAYPVAVNSLPLGWGNKNVYHRMQVDFAYRNWTHDTETNSGLTSKFGKKVKFLGFDKTIINRSKKFVTDKAYKKITDYFGKNNNKAVKKFKKLSKKYF